MTTGRPPAIVFNDSTLRDAAQLTSPAFCRRDRIDIALALEAAGIDEIELALPPAGCADLAVLSAWLVQVRINLSGPMTRRTVDAALRAGVPAVHLALPLSRRRLNRAAMQSRIARVVGYACNHGLAVTVDAEDASRADFRLVCEVIAAAETAGARRFRFNDTAGVLHPLHTHRLFRGLCAETDLELEFRGHDDFGFAAANTLAAVAAGATHVSVSMLAVDAEAQATPAPLAEMAQALSLAPRLQTRVRLPRLPALAGLVVRACDAAQPLWPSAMPPFYDASLVPPAYLAAE